VELDLEYTPSIHDQTVAVMQLAMRDHVLVYHHCRGSKYCPELREFLENKQITFVSMDTRRDIEKVRHVGIHIPLDYHIDLQAMFKIVRKGDRVGMGVLAVGIIDDSYKDMKNKCMDAMHRRWHLPLSPEHLRYAAIDAYVFYEMYKRILNMKEGLGLGHPV
jgi:ribonuclease D